MFPTSPSLPSRLKGCFVVSDEKEETNALVEHLRKAGQSRSEKKQRASRANLEKAREAKRKAREEKDESKI